MFLGSTAVYGEVFSDLGDAAWAVPYIQKVSSLGIASGYQGKFSPNESLNKYAAISMIYRTLKVAGHIDSAKEKAYLLKYDSEIDNLNVPNWDGLEEAVAFFMEKDILHMDEIKRFVVGDVHQYANRQEVAVYLGKALNLYIDENVNTIISLSFKDAGLITSSAAPYVNMLSKRGIVNGDSLGYFKPYDEISRAAMAKMLSDSYDTLKNVEVDEPEVENKKCQRGNILCCICA